MTRKILPILCFGFLQALEVQEPVAVMMGPVTEQGVRFSVMAKRSAQLAYAALQYRIAGEEDWSETQITPLPRALDNLNALDIKGLVSERRYEYRCGVFYVPDQSSLDGLTLNWSALEYPTYVYRVFNSHSNMMGKDKFSLVFGSCQYDGPLLDCLEKSPLRLVNILMKPRLIRNIGLASKFLKLPGVEKVFGGSLVGNALTILSLAEQEGEFFRTDDSQTFKTVIEFAVLNSLRLRGFIDMGDTYYRDWLNKYAGATTAEEVYNLIVDALTTEGRQVLQELVPTTVLVDDHAIRDNFTGEDLRDRLTQFDETCLRLTDLIQRQSPIYDPITGNIGYRWYETEYYGLPAFVGDFRSEAFPGAAKISQQQLQAIQAFIAKWGKHPKLLISQIPIGPDKKGQPDTDKWGADRYEETRIAILDACAAKGVANTFWLGGDIHAGMLNEVVRTKNRPTKPELRGFKCTESYPKLVIDMTNVVLAQAVASPFNWPIQFESLELNPLMPLGSSEKGTYCVVNQSDLVKQNHAGLFSVSADGNSVVIQILGNDPDNPAGRVLLERTYNLVPWR